MTSNPQPFGFQLEATQAGSMARAGRFQTAHGECLTPLFMPVGTQATVKALGPDDLRELGATCILGNTYHLYLRPGADLIAEFGGLHRFARWDRPMLTDSGGFQVFSLSHNRKISDDGVTFRSHIDGSSHLFTPERVMQLEEQIGADIIMVLDECTPYPSDEAYNRQALRRTHAWAARCQAAHGDTGQALFAIVQGGGFANLRAESAATLTQLDFPGYAIGGLSVGEPKAIMHRMLEVVTPLLPADRPRYLMGVGKPDDIIGAVLRGVDMFDCVLPTRSGRTGQAFTHDGPLNLRNARFQEDNAPLDADCACPVCAQASRAYLAHLVRSDEILGAMLLTEHNIWFYQQLMAGLRSAIGAGDVAAFAKAWVARYRGASGR